MSTNGEVSDRDEMGTIIRELSKYLQASESEQTGLGAVLKQIDETLESKHCLEIFFAKLVPLLFDASSSAEHLIVATVLVNHNPSFYALSASRAIRTFTETLVIGQEVHVSDDLLNALIAQLFMSTQISENVSHALVALATHSPPLLERIFETISSKWSDLLESIDSNVASNKEKKEKLMIGIRFASLLSLSIVNVGDVSFTYLQSTLALDHFLKLVQITTNEPLDHVILLEQCLEPIMSKVETSSSSRAMSWIDSSNVLNQLLEWTSAVFDDDCLFRDLYAPTLLRSLTSLASKMNPQQQQHLRDYIESFATGVTGEQRLNFLNIVCPWACSSKEALEYILTQDLILEPWLLVKSTSQSKLKSAVMTSLAQVMEITRERTTDGVALALRCFAQWGRINDKSASELLLTLTKSPLVEIRLGGYELMRVVMATGTGSQILLAVGGCIEFLLFPGIEDTKEGFEAKWEILKAILDSPIKNLLAEDVVTSLEKRRDQGPFHLAAGQRDVAIE